MSLTPGIHHNIPEQVYRDDPALSKSDLDRFVSPDKKLQRSAAIVGSALHCLLLEGPEASAERFITAPDHFVLNRNADKHEDGKLVARGKLWFAEFCEQHPGKAVMTPGDRELVGEMYAAVKADERAMKFLSAPGENEVSVVGAIDKFKTLCKCRIDAVRKGCLVDVKTTSCLDKAMFLDAIPKYGYATQAAFYADLYASATDTEPMPFVHLCVAKKPENGSYSVWVEPLNAEQMAFGRKHYRDLLALYERFGAIDAVAKTFDAKPTKIKPKEAEHANV